MPNYTLEEASKHVNLLLRLLNKYPLDAKWKPEMEIAIQDYGNAVRINELEWLQEHTSGGGDWRRVIIQRIRELKNNK